LAVYIFVRRACWSPIFNEGSTFDGGKGGILICDFYVLEHPVFRPQGMYQGAVFRDFPVFSWNNNNSVTLVRKRTIPTERPPLVGEVSANILRMMCRIVSVTNPYGRILRFLDRSRYYFFQVAPYLYSRGWVDFVPDPLFLRKSGSARNWTRISGSVARNFDH
jgi:hypothetical protein